MNPLQVYLPDVDLSLISSPTLLQLVHRNVVGNIVLNGKGLYPVSGDAGEEIFIKSIEQARHLIHYDPDSVNDNDYMDALVNALEILEKLRSVAEEPAESEAVTEIPIKDQVTAIEKTERRGRKSNPNSAINRAKALYDIANDKTRQTIIQRFMDELQLGKRTATTYFYLVQEAV